ncbi:MAG: Zn-dependent oxidoreductase, NADPH:quinone reductase [Mycobacterium sp.]|nr:Zn-dependent oxidoreductase, NADPH:quinone reductase [Mycobacterium sp.]
MHALRAHQRGGAEQLRYETAPTPTPAPDEVLIAVRAAGITFAELTWDETWTRNGLDRTPIVPSHEVSGTVTELGSEVTGFAVGDDVYGLIRFDRDGAAAEFVVVPAADLAPKPASVSHIEAAAVPLAALTAWQALLEHADLQAGQHVLVHGGAGGVGVFVVQLAAEFGAIVTATARAKDIPFVTSLGAARVIDFEVEAFDANDSSYDVVVDSVGGDTLDRSFAVVRAGGHLITLSAPPSQEKAASYGITATFFVVEPDRDALTRLAALIDAGTLQIPISATFALSQGRAAYESGAVRGRRPGKTVLVVDERDL